MTMTRQAAGEAVPVLTSKIGTCNSTPLISGAIAVAAMDQVLCIFQTGDMAAETIDFKVQTCDSDGTSNVADLKAATQLAAHATNNDNKVVVISIRQEDLIASGKKHIRMYGVTGGATGGTCAYTATGLAAKYGPGSGSQSAQVLQVKL